MSQESPNQSAPILVHDAHYSLERKLLSHRNSKNPFADEPNSLGKDLPVLPDALVAVLRLLGMTIFLRG